MLNQTMFPMEEHAVDIKQARGFYNKDERSMLPTASEPGIGFDRRP